uniref:U3 small nucleolar RNA-associated protein 18 homolog (Trinotate prediction) n=1 Tax=Myxobolus squamalis TaxID=59785 RepID=A0A6B2FZT6_MYXSQ
MFYFIGSSNSGLVSLFDFTQSLNRTSDSHKVIKEFGNLSCSTSSVKFNYKLNLMCFASNSLKKGIRMVNLTNMSVLSSWPFTQIDNKIGRVYDLDFSSDGKYIAMANNDGRIMIHQLPIIYTYY